MAGSCFYVSSKLIIDIAQIQHGRYETEAVTMQLAIFAAKSRCAMLHPASTVATIPKSC